MFKIIAVLAVIGLAQSYRITRETAVEVVPILRSESDKTEDGGYSFSFEGGDGSFREEKAIPMNIGQEDAFLHITGSYRYIDAEGEPIEVHYTADNHGFVPSGKSIHPDITDTAKNAPLLDTTIKS